MILCRYFDENGLDSLCNLRLKVTNPDQFNDPFEFSPFIEGEFKHSDFKHYFKHPATIDKWYAGYNHIIKAKNKKEFKRIIRSKDIEGIFNRIKPNFTNNVENNMIEENLKKICDDCRVLCFSNLDELKAHEEILMWSHYTRGHSGLRISFNINKIKLRTKGPDRVEYRNERVMLNMGKLVIFDPQVFEDFGKSLLVKSVAWEYEREYRWLIRKRDCFVDKVDYKNYDFIRISPEAITRVDIGVNSTNEFKSKVLNALKLEHFKHVDIRVAKVHKQKFQLDYNEV